MNLRSKNPIGLMIHCSDSNYGDVDLFRKWHHINGWDDIGYNWVITNGIFKNRAKYKKENDGILQRGRETKYLGAHAKEYNESFLSICLVGRWHFTGKQFQTLFKTVDQLQKANYIDHFVPGNPLTIKNFKGHYEVSEFKTCPNIDMDWLREQLNLYLRLEISDEKD